MFKMTHIAGLDWSVPCLDIKPGRVCDNGTNKMALMRLGNTTYPDAKSTVLTNKQEECMLHVAVEHTQWIVKWHKIVALK